MSKSRAIFIGMCCAFGCSSTQRATPAPPAPAAPIAGGQPQQRELPAEPAAPVRPAPPPGLVIELDQAGLRGLPISVSVETLQQLWPWAIIEKRDEVHCVKNKDVPHTELHVSAVIDGVTEDVLVIQLDGTRARSISSSGSSLKLSAHRITLGDSYAALAKAGTPKCTFGWENEEETEAICELTGVRFHFDGTRGLPGGEDAMAGRRLVTWLTRHAAELHVGEIEWGKPYGAGCDAGGDL